MAHTPADESVAITGVADDLPITPQATTSRVAVDNDVLRVVLFAFDTGEQLTEHTAAMPALVQLVRGTMRFEVTGEVHELRSGDCVYLAAHEPHALTAHEPCLMSLTLVRGGGES